MSNDGFMCSVAIHVTVRSQGIRLKTGLSVGMVPFGYDLMGVTELCGSLKRNISAFLF